MKNCIHLNATYKANDMPDNNINPQESTGNIKPINKLRQQQIRKKQ